jgi:molecular chaperone DnaJ
VLGVDRSAGETEVKKAFRRLARELHPDVNRHDPDAEERFKEAAEAYEVLSDPERRRTYDRYGHEGLRSGGWAPSFDDFGSFADIFDAFFGDDLFGGARAQRGGDVAAVTLEFAEAAFGVERRLDIKVIGDCDRCGGSGAEPGPSRTRATPAAVRRAAGAADGARPVRADRRLLTCGGRGVVIETRAAAPRARTAAGGRDGRGADPGRNHGRPAAAAARPRQPGPAGRAARRPLRRRAGQVASQLPARRQRRDGAELPFTRAALGTNVTVETLDGEQRWSLRPAPSPATLWCCAARACWC